MQAELEQVGARLRSARQAQGLTLQELADSAGMSVSTLSRLESGKRQASLELLIPVTRRLGLRIDDLLRPQTVDPRVRRPVIRRAGMIIAPLTPEHSPVAAFKIAYPARGAAPPAQVHDGYEWLYVLSGRLRLILGEQDLVLAAGEAAEFDTRTPHAMAAAGDEAAQVISIFNETGARMHTHTTTD